VRGRGKLLPSPDAAARSDDGFTVAEMLVSLIILALVMSFLPGTLRLGQRIWETDGALSRQEGVAAFRRAAGERLAAAMPVFVRDPLKGLRIEFQGEPDRVTFIAAAPSGPAGGGVYRFELAESEERVPVLRQTLYRQETEERTPLPSVTHVSPAGARGLSFRYFGPARAGEAPQWLAQWPRKDVLPALIEMTFVQGGDAPAQRSVVEFRLRPGG
jgi:prepilin-type N-terminal cleavage/methylation domain-containing protein